MWLPFTVIIIFFFFNDTATTEIYTLSLHDALPIYLWPLRAIKLHTDPAVLSFHYLVPCSFEDPAHQISRSEEHTSELQSRQYLVCRLLLEKKKILLLNYSIVYPLFIISHYSLLTSA